MTPTPASPSALAATIAADAGAAAAVIWGPNIGHALAGVVVAIAGLVSVVYVHERHATIRATTPTAPIALAGVIARLANAAEALEHNLGIVISDAFGDPVPMPKPQVAQGAPSSGAPRPPGVAPGPVSGVTPGDHQGGP